METEESVLHSLSKISPGSGLESEVSLRAFLLMVGQWKTDPYFVVLIFLT